MPLKKGSNRHQLQMLSLDQLISKDHLVRVIEAFVHTLSLEELGFVVKGKSVEGRPAYGADILLKLYLYGYQNRIRSSRRLERECGRNVELWWLLHQQVPCYKTIASFRKDNAPALKKVFRRFVQMCKGWLLYGGQTIAVDGSKFRGVNSKKANYNAKKIQRHLDYIDGQLADYFEQLNKQDEEESEGEQQEGLQTKMEKLHDRRRKYEQLADELEQSGERQLSATDRDARALPLHMGIVEVGYNVQIAVEETNKLIADYEVTNEKDTYALSGIAIRSKEILGVENLDVLADKGYHTGSEMKACTDHQISTYIAPKDTSVKSKAPAYRKDRFVYNAEEDTYTCPQFQVLRSNGNWYKKNKGKGRKPYRVKVYKLPFKVCNACPVKLQCAGAANLKNSKGRPIERSEYDDYLKANKERVAQNKDYYRQRQYIVEHPFGTIKRQWGYDHTLLKGKEKVDGDFALIFLSYNLRRAMSCLGALELIRRLKELFFGFLGLSALVKAHVSKFSWRMYQPPSSRILVV